MTAQNRFYRPVSEQDTQEGYVDIFLCPMLEIYSDMKHSYIVELKYAKYRIPKPVWRNFAGKPSPRPTAMPRRKR